MSAKPLQHVPHPVNRATLNWLATTSCPLTYAPPFCAPLRRELKAPARDRILGWFEELVSHKDVNLIEWVGTDPRQPLHAVVASFPKSHRPPIVLALKVEEVSREHLLTALDAQPSR